MDVFVVEDDPLVRETVACGLEDVGLAVAIMPTAEPAIESATRTGPPRVLVTDIDLGAGLDGVALAAIFAAHWPEVAVVFITGRDDKHLDGHALGPHQRLVSKPFSLAALAGIVLGFTKQQPRGTDAPVGLAINEESVPSSPGGQQGREIVTGHSTVMHPSSGGIAGRAGHPASHASCRL